MTTRRGELCSLALLLALTLAMFGDVLFVGSTRVVGHPITDLYLQFLPWRDFGFRELAKGNLALWNPHIFGGAPYFGAMQAALLYPPNCLFAISALARLRFSRAGKRKPCTLEPAYFWGSALFRRDASCPALSAELFIFNFCPGATSVFASWQKETLHFGTRIFLGERPISARCKLPCFIRRTVYF